MFNDKLCLQIILTYDIFFLRISGFSMFSLALFDAEIMKKQSTLKKCDMTNHSYYPNPENSLMLVNVQNTYIKHTL